MSTPTPRTDAAWASSFNHPVFSSAHTARTMRDECAELERELAAEREKVKTLRSACESICEEWGKSHDTPFYAGNKMDALATAALAATEDAQ